MDISETIQAIRPPLAILILTTVLLLAVGLEIKAHRGQRSMSNAVVPPLFMGVTGVDGMYIVPKRLGTEINGNEKNEAA